MATYTVTTNADSGAGSLREAITYANANPGTTIHFGISNQIITLLSELPLILGDNTVIDGEANNIAIDGGSTSVTSGYRVFFIGDAGLLGSATDITHATIANLTIAHANAHGGDTVNRSGAGAGLGGAIFVSSTGDLTVGNVTLTDNDATGGSVASGPVRASSGGGMGGNGSQSLNSGGGGGFGRAATGGSSEGNGGNGAFTGAPDAADGTNGAGGAAGGGGGGGRVGGGGGGGVGGTTGSGGTGGNGGFGGGGGGGFGADGGNGGFGGGGGGVAISGAGGNGGFGGGGGGTFSGFDGSGGFGGGAGVLSGSNPQGGGGAGMGGAVFVMGGGKLTLVGQVTVSDNSATGGTGGAGNNGSGFGAGFFLQGDGGTITFQPGADETQTLSDVIADQTGSGGSGTYATGGATGGSYSGAGSWALTKTGDGTLILGAANTYSGATTVSAGKLIVNGSIANSATTVASGATLEGGGSIGGSVTVQSGGHIAPGASAGDLATGIFDLQLGSFFDVEIGGTTAGTQYDQLIVNGTVTLAGALSTSLLVGFNPTTGSTYTIILNDGADAVSGTFNGLAEGATFTQGGSTYSITYTGDTGNDVVLTAQNDAPTLTTMAAVVDTVVEDTQVEITFAEIAAQGDEADDGTVTAFVVKAVTSGTLLIGTSAGTATAFAAGTNDTIDGANKAYWTAAQDANGTRDAFTVVASDDGGLESATPVQVRVSVTPANDAPAITSDGGGATASLSRAENATAVTTVTADDPDSASLTFSIVGGADETKVQIDPVTGVLSFVDAPDFEQPGDADGNNSYVVQVRASDGSLTDEQTITVNVTDVMEPTKGQDFNADTFGDIFWEVDGGPLAVWEMNGEQIAAADYTRAGSSTVGRPGVDWHIVDTGDFGGDGRSDVLWRTDSGALALWEMDGNQIVAADYLRNGSAQLNAPGADWHALGALDADGDSKSDILWRTDSGALAIWAMDGNQLKSADYIRAGATAIGQPGADWNIVGTGDFDGDGKSDILWRTDGGALAVWHLDGTQLKSADYLKAGSSTVGAPGADWHVSDVADFNGDGRADILWRTGAAQTGDLPPGGGQVAIWQMNGNQIEAADYTRLGSSAVGAPGADWHLLGADDHNGDGKADLLWQTDGGAVAIWEMDGTQVTDASYTRAGSTTVGTPGSDWHIYEHSWDLV